MATGFEQIAQADFSAGMFRGIARHHIPPNGVYDALNSLFDDDGQIYRRGGSEYKTTFAFGATGLVWVWDGQLAPGQRTVFASTSSFGALAANDSSIITLGGAGLAGPTKAVQVGDLLFIGGGVIYGGSRMSADYSTGTVSITQGTKVVTGSGTLWLGPVDAGELIRFGGAGPYYVVASVDSNTQLTLTEPLIAATISGGTYALTRLGSAASHGAPAVEVYATMADRLLAASGRSLRVSASYALLSPATVPQYQTHSFAATDLQQYAGDILGAEALRDTLLVFTVNGIFALTGLAFDETDDSGNPQWTSEPLNNDLILWSKEGIATYRNELVVPCTDGVWSVGIASAPRLLSRSINAALYLPYVRQGFKTGLGVVYGNHYFLPILDASNVVIDQLVCRLDRPVQTAFGECFPWARFDGHGGNITAWATRAGGVSTQRTPLLLAASRATTSHLLNMTPVFTPASQPDATHKNDADATTFNWQTITRDYAVGPIGSTVRRLRMTYELIDAATDDPTITGAYSKGSELPGAPHWDDVNWNEFSWAGDDTEYAALPGEAPEDTGRNPFNWTLAADTRYIRARLSSQDPCSLLKLRSLEWSVVGSGRQ